MRFRDLLRKMVPLRFLNWYRERKKKKVRSDINQQRLENKGFSLTDLQNQLRSMGVEEGDSVLVHSSLSKMGFVDGGPKTVIESLLHAVGGNGNILMPTSPNDGLQLEYIRKLDVFDVKHTPSKLGIISETFRKDFRSRRSGSPTEPVSAIGRDAEFFTEGQIDQETPYDDQSPFYKLAKKKGKILYVGCTLDNAGTSLHLLEDAVKDFKFPVYYPEKFEAKIRTEDGELQRRMVKVHNPEMSAKRKCDQLIPLFEEAGIVKHVVFGKAPTLLFDAEKMLDFMIKAYQENGVTMYTPKGS